MDERYPKMADAPWREIHLFQEGLCSFHLTTSEYGEALLSGTCPARKAKTPIVYEAPFIIHGQYVYDLYELHPEILPDLPKDEPGIRRLELVLDDGTRHRKPISDEVFDQIAERLTSAMQVEDHYDKKKAREWRQEDYKLFAAIRRNEVETVKAMIEEDPSLVNAVAPKKPVETKNFSPLMVALSAGWLRDEVNWHTEINWKPEIAWFLLEHGADVNYREPKIVGSPCVTVISAAAKNAVRNIRMHHEYSGEGHYVRVHTKEEADESFAFLKAVLERGADPNLDDTYGNNALYDAVAEARNYYWDSDPQETRDDLHRIFKLLIQYGADRGTVDDLF